MDDRPPRTAIMEDLYTDVMKWRQSGDSIIILGDFNEDVRSNYLCSWRDSLGLRDAMLDTIGNEVLPASYVNGKDPIDSIWVSANVEIVRSVSLPFDQGVGDHRPIMIDVSTTSVMGTSVPPTPSVRARKLKLGDPRIIKKYLDLLRKFYNNNDFYTKVYALSRLKIEYPIQPQVAIAYEQLDSIRTRGMKYAESKCRKFYGGKVPWNPELTEAHYVIELWTLVIRRLEGRKVSARTILRKKRQCNIDESTMVTRSYAHSKLHQAYTKYSTITNQATKRRSTFLEDLAMAKAKEGNSKASTELLKMRRLEKVRASWARIHRMDGSVRQSKGLCKVISPDYDGNWTEKCTKNEVEQGLLEENERRFTQAFNTPLTIPPLSSDFGLLGNGPEADNLLQGNYTPPSSVDPTTAEVLSNLSITDTPKHTIQPTPITCNELCEGWQRVKERTSSSPSTLHVGHWKAVCSDPATTWVNMVMINIPYISGYSPKRWQHGLNVMIEKIKGNCRVDKLRTILLYEADFNMMNKFIGKKMMQYAENYELIAPVQYGGRKRKSANTHALNKRLIFDILRQKRQSSAICSCDLKSCYDRVVHAFAALAMRRAGVAESATVSMFDTIQKLVHRVRTAFGDSIDSFGGEIWRDLEPLFGLGQGNGAGPAIWAIISSIFFDVLKKNGYGAVLTTPFSKEILKIEGIGFVDDTDILQTGLAYDDYMDIAEKLQAAVALWEKCTELSGGCLVPSKSWWTIVDFTWNKGRWSYASDFEEASLRIKSVTGQLEDLRLLSPFEAQKMLGVWLAPDGNNTKQIAEMRDITTKWAEKVRTGTIDKRDSWQALTKTVLKKLEYPLVALNLTEKECRHIMAPALAAGLSRSGVCQKISRCVLYGNVELQGMGLHNIFTTMGIVQIQAIVEHTWGDSLSGKLIQTSLESLKMEVGITGSLFHKNFTLLGQLATDCWLKSVWSFCWNHNITINDNVPDSGILRERDTLLTDCFANAYALDLLSMGDWKRANICRIYLQVISVCDVSTGDGRKISSCMWEGHREASRSRNLEWVIQGEPTPTDWTAWRRALTITLCSGEDTRLSTPLGFWLNDADRILTEWLWFWDPQDKNLYKKYGQGWLRYRQSSPGRRTRARHMGFQSPVYVNGDDIADRLERTTVVEQDGSYFPEGSYPIRRNLSEHNSANRPPSDFIQEYLGRQETRWAAKKLFTTPSIGKIIQELSQGTIVAVSDGSYKDGIGTACYIIESEDATERIVGLVDVPGREDEQDSYRSELAGVYGIINFLSILSKYGEINDGHVVVACDGKGALYKAFDVLNNVTTRAPHFDLLSGIHYIRRTLPYTIIPKHVKGHQDRQGASVIDRLALLNIECDFHAKVFWDEIQPGYRRSKFSIPGAMWALKVNKLAVGTRCGKYLRNSIEGKSLLDYWVHTRQRFPANSLQCIDTSSLKMAAMLISSERQRWLAKFLSGWCATGTKMLKWKKRIVDVCPRCNFRGENTEHILECRADGALEIWEKELDKLDLWLIAEGTCPDLRYMLIGGIRRWKFGVRYVNREHYSYPGAIGAARSQSSIGWRRLIEGTISVEWRKTQSTYYKLLEIPKSAEKWAAKLVIQLWDIVFVVWQHRNSVLHDTPLADLLGGGYALERALHREWNIGFDNLPEIVQATVPQSISTVMAGSTADRKGWFVLVRRARENIAGYEPIDEFSDPKSGLRKWVGM